MKRSNILRWIGFSMLLAMLFAGVKYYALPNSAEQEETRIITKKEKTLNPVVAEGADQQRITIYVLNANTKKFHYPGCGSAKRIGEGNRHTVYGIRERLVTHGYSPCGNCDP